MVYSNGIVSRIVKYDFGSGKTSEVKLPITGTAFISCPDWTSDLCHVAMTSWTLPVTRYDYDPRNETFAKSLFNEDVIYPGFENLVAEEVEVPSHDGVMVPLSIVHQKQMKLDGSNCCILEGYGAYGMTYPANCGVMHSVATHGVVLAFAHPRGGGEKGEAWYKAGYKATKPNTWKDFIASPNTWSRRATRVRRNWEEPAPAPEESLSAGQSPNVRTYSGLRSAMSAARI